MIYYSLYHPDRGVYIIMQILCFRGGGEMDTGKKIRKGRKDPVRILPDPGWFSESRTSIVRLTPKVYNKKKAFIFNRIIITSSVWGTEPRTRFFLAKTGSSSLIMCICITFVRVARWQISLGCSSPERPISAKALKNYLKWLYWFFFITIHILKSSNLTTMYLTQTFQKVGSGSCFFFKKDRSKCCWLFLRPIKRSCEVIFIQT